MHYKCWNITELSSESPVDVSGSQASPGTSLQSPRVSKRPIPNSKTVVIFQSYPVNLQLTSVVAKLALVPHPNLHEFLLDPYLPLKPGVRTLYTVLQKVSGQKHHLSRDVGKPTFWFLTWSDVNRAVQLQKMTRGLKFRI